MQTAVRKRAADFDFWGDTPTPEFCENSHERGPRSPAGTAQGFDPPLGAQRNAAARGGDCDGVGRTRRKGGGVPRRAGSGQGAVSGGTAGAFGAGSRGVPSGRRAANGARAGLGRVGPTKAACRARRRGAGTCRAAGRGRNTAAFRGGRGEGVSRAAVYGGRAGYSRGRRAYCRGAAGGGPGRAKNALSCAACVG